MNSPSYSLFYFCVCCAFRYPLILSQAKRWKKQASRIIKQTEWISVLSDAVLSLLFFLLPSQSSLTSHVYFDFIWFLFILLHTLSCERHGCSGEGGGFFFSWDFPPTPSIFPELGVYCCWPFKGNYDRIMLRGQLWRKNGNTWTVSMMLAGKPQWKVRNPQLKPPSITTSGMLFCPGNYSGSMSAVLPVCLISSWNGQVVYNTVRRICGGCKNDLCRTRHMAWKCNFSDSEWILLLKYYKAEISALLIW